MATDQQTDEQAIGPAYSNNVPTHFFFWGFLYPLSMKSAGMNLNLRVQGREVKCIGI